jgi:hypothetical protein
MPGLLHCRPPLTTIGGSAIVRPDGSRPLFGLLLAYTYGLIPPAKPTGSSLTNRPVAGSYHRARTTVFFCTDCSSTSTKIGVARPATPIGLSRQWESSPEPTRSGPPEPRQRPSPGWRDRHQLVTASPSIAATAGYVHNQVMVTSVVFRTRHVVESRKTDISSRALPPPGRPVGRT